MGKAVGNGAGAFILAGVLLGFPDSLFQGGDAGFVLGVNHHIIIPGVAALGRGGVFVTGNGGHGQADKEGIGGGSHHLGNGGFHAQIQANRQVPLNGLAVLIGLGHDNGTILGGHVGFQSVLDGGGVGGQGSCQSLVQGFGGVIIIVLAELVGVVCIGVPASTISQADGGQQVSGLYLVEAVQNLGQVVVGVLVIGGFRKGNNVGYLQGGEFHALQSIAVGVLAVAQVVAGAAIGIALPDSVAQHIFHIAFTPAGGDEGILVPNTVLDGVGPVILKNRQRAGGA